MHLSIYIYIYIHPGPFCSILDLGNFKSQDFNLSLRCFCLNSSSPQISPILSGNFTMENGSLRKSPPKTCAKIAQKNVKHLAHKIH